VYEVWVHPAEERRGSVRVDAVLDATAMDGVFIYEVKPARACATRPWSRDKVEKHEQRPLASPCLEYRVLEIIILARHPRRCDRYVEDSDRVGDVVQV
jgi:hypothetical protein